MEKEKRKNKAAAFAQQLLDKDSRLCKSLIFVLLGIFLIIGLFTLRQYGSPWDEEEEITIFIGNLKEYARLFFGEDCEFNQLASSIDYARDNANIDHGESLYYILAPFARMFLEGNELGFVHLWRTVILIICLLGAYFLYLIVKHFTSDARYGLLASLMLLLSPRFFAESTYNHKDLAQMTLWLALMWFTIMWMKKREYKWAVALGVAAGFAINMRFAAAMGYFVCGVIYCVMIFTDKDRKSNVKSGILQGVVSVVTCLAVLFVITPGCWQGLHKYIFYCLTQSTSFPWRGSVFFGGEMYAALELTRWYLPVSIAITIPLIFIPLFLLGNVVTIFGIKVSEKTGKKRIYCKLDLYTILLVGMTYFSFIAYLIIKPVIYNSWRHYYFLYGFILIWAVLGFRYLIRLGKKAVTAISSGLMAVQLVALCVIIAITHPYQFTYYNILAGIHPEERYEMDYWGVSGKDTIIELIKNEYEEEPLKITGLESSCNSILDRGIFILPDEYADKIQFVEYIKDADYVFVNYTYSNEYRNSDLLKYVSKYEKVAEVEYLSTPLAAVYKLK